MHFVLNARRWTDDFEASLMVARSAWILAGLGALVTAGADMARRGHVRFEFLAMVFGGIAVFGTAVGLLLASPKALRRRVPGVPLRELKLVVRMDAQAGEATLTLPAGAIREAVNEVELLLEWWSRSPTQPGRVRLDRKSPVESDDGRLCWRWPLSPEQTPFLSDATVVSAHVVVEVPSTKSKVDRYLRWENERR
jgi:hypothetical protein